MGKENDSTAKVEVKTKASKAPTGAKAANSATGVKVYKTTKTATQKTAAQPKTVKVNSAKADATKKPAPKAKRIDIDTNEPMPKGGTKKATAIKPISTLAIDGMVKPKAETPAKTPEKIAEPIPAEPTETPKTEKKDKKSRFTKKQKIIMGIVAGVVVLAGAGFGAAAMLGNKNGRHCTVDFETNGGSEVESIEVVCGTKAKKPEDPTKDGFEFREWSYRGKKFDFSRTNIDEDIVLVAKWSSSDEGEKVTVTFDTAGGSTIEAREVRKGASTVAPVMPTRDGYEFDGWYLDGEEFNFTDPINSDITLVAHWKEKKEEDKTTTVSRPAQTTTSTNIGGYVETTDQGNSEEESCDNSEPGCGQDNNPSGTGNTGEDIQTPGQGGEGGTGNEGDGQGGA